MSGAVDWTELDALSDEVNALRQENARLRRWVADLQSGMFVNCVYCGHRYGPDPGTQVAMADVLKAHISECQEHPMSKLRVEFDALLANYLLLVKTAHDLEHPYNE